MNEVLDEEVVRLSLKKNPYYSSPKCSVLETDSSHGYKFFGVREEYDAKTFTRKEECQVYLARTGFGQEKVELTVMVIAEVTPGLSTECEVQMAARAGISVKFCAEEWSCVEGDQEDEDDVEVVDSDESCAEEWGCIENIYDTGNEEEVIDMDIGTNCSGEWGCFDNEIDKTDEIDTEPVDSESEMETKSLSGVVPEARFVNSTHTRTDQAEDDIMHQLVETLMSADMAPLTLSMLTLLGVTLLVGMWCLGCKGTCRSSRKAKRSDSMSSSISNDTKIIIGTLQREKSNQSRISRTNSVRSSMRSHSSNNFDDDLVMYFGDEEEDDKDYSAEEIVISGKRALFTVSEEIDPTEDGLESMEWDDNSKNNNKPDATYLRSHHGYEINDFPSFYI